MKLTLLFILFRRRYGLRAFRRSIGFPRTRLGYLPRTSFPSAGYFRDTHYVIVVQRSSLHRMFTRRTQRGAIFLRPFFTCDNVVITATARETGGRSGVVWVRDAAVMIIISQRFGHADRNMFRSTRRVFFFFGFLLNTLISNDEKNNKTIESRCLRDPPTFHKRDDRFIIIIIIDYTFRDLHNLL